MQTNFPVAKRERICYECDVMQPVISTDTPLLRGPTSLVRQLLERHLQPGNRVADATCGNGHDTLLLAELVGPTGRVWAFDIQREAIGETARRLEQAGMAGRVELIHGGHESMAERISVPLAAVVFNLGYRPGGDRAVITGPDTTLAALEQATNLLAPRGILTVTVYPGHAGGAGEERAVSAWASGLEQRRYHAWRMGQANVPPGAPHLFLVQKVA